MLYRVYLLFVYTTLCFLSLYYVNAFPGASWAKKQVRMVNFQWGNCGPPADPFQIKAFDLGPDPLRIPGNVTAGMTFSFQNPSPTDITMLVVMEKNIAGFWIKVPCTDNIGSCTYQNICTDWSEACTALFSQFGLPCNCPIPAGTYTIPDISVEATQTLPSGASGTFRVFADLLSGSAGQLGCLGFEISISS